MIFLGSSPRRGKALLDALGTIEAIAKATDEQRLAVPGINERILSGLRAALLDG